MKDAPPEPRRWLLRLPGAKTCLAVLGASNLFLLLAVIAGLSGQGGREDSRAFDPPQGQLETLRPSDELLSWLETQEAQRKELQREVKKARIIYIAIGFAGFVNLLFLFLLFVRNQDEHEERN